MTILLQMPHGLTRRNRQKNEFNPSYLHVTGKNKSYRRIRKVRKTIGLIFATIVFVAGLSVESFAQSGIDTRQRRQQGRIYQGVNSGRLTRAEAYRLQRQQFNIYRAESRYRSSGGRFTYAERRNIQRRLNYSSRSIYRQKHDRQNRRVVSAMPFPWRRY